MSTEPAKAGQIRSSPRPACRLCGSDGELIYRAQPDRLFGTAGSWNLKQCNNRDCRLVWLDPMPLEEDLGKAYASYYTHTAAGPPSAAQRQPSGWARRIYRLMKRGYLASKYGYEIGTGAFLNRHVGKLLYLFPKRRLQQDLEVRFLSAVPQGRLLDVGCGQGLWLRSMRELGWRVDGVDFDERAVKAGAEGGLAIRCGSLEQQNFSGATFDAVTMSHVIEHLPDPVRTLTECARILKPGGKLVLWTPNTASLGHRVLKQHWRGLEPPRHLHLFSPASLRILLERAGFDRLSIRTRNSRYIWQQGLLLRMHQLDLNPGVGAKVAGYLLACAFSLFEAGVLMAKGDAGEWIDAHACKS